MIIPMLCVTIFVILVVWFLLPRSEERRVGKECEIGVCGENACIINACESDCESIGYMLYACAANLFFFSSRRRHTISVSAFLLNRSSDLMRQAHADGWFIVFDTLTLADDRLEAFYDNPNALRDYFRDIGRMVLAA